MVDWTYRDTAPRSWQGDRYRMRGACKIEQTNAYAAIVTRKVGDVTLYIGVPTPLPGDPDNFDDACDAAADAVNAMAERLASPCCGGCAEVAR